MQSCRGKVLAFLLAEKREDGVILLRGTRDELASRLSVSRAALYRELSALQSVGYLEVGESRFRVLNTSADGERDEGNVGTLSQSGKLA